MKQADLDRAFAKTPECIRASIEYGFQKGRKAMKLRHKIMSALPVAAALTVTFAVAALALGQLGAPKPDVFSGGKPRGTPVPHASPATTGGAQSAAPAPTEAPGSAASTAVPAPEETPAVVVDEPLYYATAGGRYYHAKSDCSGLEGAEAFTLEDVESMGKTPCPLCVEERVLPAEVVVVVDEPLYYATMGGRYYHAKSDCSGLEGAEAYALEDVESMGKTPCPLCVEGNVSYTLAVAVGVPADRALSEAYAPLFFYTPGGAYFHLEPDCSGMQNAGAHSLESALALFKRHCPVCIGDNADVYSLPAPEADTDPVYIGANIGDYHRTPDCSGMLDACELPLESAVRMGKAACPACLPERSEGQPEAAEAYYATENGKYYHASAGCSGMQNAAPIRGAAARAEGKHLCPACGAFIVPEHYELFQTAFGQNLTALYPDRIYAYSSTAGDSASWVMCDGQVHSDVAVYAPADGVRDASITLNFPYDADGVPGFMSALPDPLKTLFVEQLSGAVRQYLGSRSREVAFSYAWLSSIRVFFDDGGQVSGCILDLHDPENAFIAAGESSAFSLGWKRNAQGAFEPCDYADEWAHERGALS